jgi:transcription termination factor Rho
MPTSVHGEPAAATGPQTVPIEGLLELHPDGYGFIRTFKVHFQVTPNDAYVPADVIRRLELREGLRIVGEASAPMPEPYYNNGYDQRGPQRGRGGGRDFRGRQQNFRPQPRKPQGPRLLKIISVEGKEPEAYRGAPVFDQLTPIDPRKWMFLETPSDATSGRMTTRVVDMFCPIGMGTRGLIVAPPRTGKTILIQHIADSIADNHPDVELIVLLVDERPEEVTEMKRTIRGSVYASNNDQETSSHVRVAELAIERAKRLAETGRDVVVLLDSITRLARAYNKHVGSGRTMTGGLDIRALEIPKRLLGAARAFDEGGSLTILGTALVETGSKMDDVIFQEFKGTGNMELVLDRKLSDRRLYPAINISQSGTRKEERLLPAENLERITVLRRALLKLNDVEAMETLLKQLKKHPTNKEFLSAIAKTVS